MTAKSLLYAPGQVLHEPPECGPCRREVITRLRKDGKIYTLVMRDKAIIEDPYLVQVKAAIYSVQQEEPYMGRIVPRSVRDFLIKSSVTP
jgi:hypothetical protein